MALLGGGLGLLLVAIVSSVMLVMQHLGSFDLPGCGPDSGCARAANSVWGTLPGVGWPTSFVGLAYFLGLAAAWIVSKCAVPSGLRWVIRLGVVGSVVLIIAMIAGGYLCPYCIAVHAANILFAGVVERATRGPRAGAPRPVPALASSVAMAALFILASGALGIAEMRHRAERTEHSQAQLEESTRTLVERSGRDDLVAGEPFTGRYREGDRDAPIRIVIFSDYQCPHCRRIEGDVEAILAARDDVSYTHKHFPMCTQCNHFAAKRNYNPHPNACWAARAAEAAGILGGEEGFWTMHRWLFQEKGSFTDQSLPGSLREMGFEPGQFTQVMMSDRTLTPVKADIRGSDRRSASSLHADDLHQRRRAEGLATRTNALQSVAVDDGGRDESACGSLPPYGPPAEGAREVHRRLDATRAAAPDSARRRQRRGRSARPTRPRSSSSGATTRSPAPRRSTERLRAAIDETSVTTSAISFRHYPVNQSCNPTASRTLHPLACRMSQAAEAAGRIGGDAAYWSMHVWLLENQASFDEQKLRGAALRMGLDPAALLREMDSNEVKAAIAEDCFAAKQLNINPIPYFWVNGRWVPRWRLEDAPAAEAIIDYAAGKR